MKPQNKDFKYKLQIDEGNCLYYNELPVNKRYRKPFVGYLNEMPCVIFRKQASGSALSYLMKKYPEMGLFEEVKDFSPTIIDCFEEHGMAFYFSVEADGVEQPLVAIIDGPLWETAVKDFYELLNLIHYCVDYSENPGGVFMDDYGLC